MSAINTGSIDVNFPVPGVNNSSQGFRSNFSAIKSNLDTADTEITDLQNKAVLKSAIPGVTLDNDMNNTLISNAQTLGFRASSFPLGNNLNGVVTIDLTKGDIQYGTITGDATLTFTKWAPAGTLSTVQVLLNIESPTIKLTLPSSVVIGINTIENCKNNVITIPGSQGIDNPSTLHLLFSTLDCGTTLEVVPINRPRKTTQIITKVPTTSKGVAGDQAGQVCVDSNYIYVCVADYDGTANIWKRVALTGGSW